MFDMARPHKVIKKFFTKCLYVFWQEPECVQRNAFLHTRTINSNNQRKADYVCVYFGNSFV